MSSPRRLLLALLAVVSIAACGGNASDAGSRRTTTTETEPATAIEGSTTSITSGNVLDDQATDYPDGFVELGVAGCTQRGANDEGTCRCFFNGIFTTVEFQVMKDYGARITIAEKNGEDPNDVEKPTEVQQVADDCGYAFV